MVQMFTIVLQHKTGGRASSNFKFCSIIQSVVFFTISVRGSELLIPFQIALVVATAAAAARRGRGGRGIR
jgi:hypothetical protein